MSLRTAAQQALEALEYYEHIGIDWCYADKEAINALRAALAEPDQDDTALLRQALEALESRRVNDYFVEHIYAAITALRERLGNKT